MAEAGGIVQTALDQDDPMKNVSTVNANTIDVNEPKSTVQGQIEGMFLSIYG